MPMAVAIRSQVVIPPVSDSRSELLLMANHWFVLVCSHFRTCEFFNEALLNPEAFLATKCDSYEKYLNGLCDGNDQVSLGGNLLGHEGDYFFTTNAEPPYSKN